MPEPIVLFLIGYAVVVGGYTWRQECKWNDRLKLRVRHMIAGVYAALDELRDKPTTKAKVAEITAAQRFLEVIDKQAQFYGWSWSELTDRPAPEDLWDEIRFERATRIVLAEETPTE